MEKVLCIALAGLLAAVLAEAPGCRTFCTPRDAVHADFESSPLDRGWHGERRMPQPFAGGRVVDPLEPDDRCVLVRRGRWKSPLLRARPGKLYRLSYEALTKSPGMWHVFFYTSDGAEIHGDHYSRIYASGDDWSEQTFFFQARHESRFMMAGFEPQHHGPLYLDDISIRLASRAEALRWIGRELADLPPLTYSPSPDRWEHLPRTRRTLQEGGRLRIVALGDSIINDTTNSLFHIRLGRMYPEADIDLIRSVRGGTGCSYYREDNRVDRYVLRHNPDLLIIGGISNDSIEGIRDVIRQVQANHDTEILVLSGAISQFLKMERRQGRFHETGDDSITPSNARFREELESMCAEQNVAFLDMRRIWKDFLDAHGSSSEPYRRDIIHANHRGKLLLGEILVRFFRRGPS